MATVGTKASEEAKIRAAIDDCADASREKDVDRVMAHYDADVVVCDLAPPLQSVGKETLRKNYAEWFSTWDGPIGIDIRDLHVTYGDDIAFCRSFHRISGTKLDGEKPDVWARATICFRKIGGKWMVTHEHMSVPFYMDGSYKAAVDLEP